MNVKKEVEMWDVTQIFDYAMQFYSEYIGDSKNEKSYADKCKKHIRRTLSECCSFTPRCDDKGSEKYAIPVIFAKEVVEYFLYDYFTEKPEEEAEKYRKKLEEQQKKELKAIEAKSLKKDNQKNSDEGVDFILGCMNEMIKQDPTNPLSEKLQERIDNYTEKSKRYRELTSGTKIEKSTLEYHIPDFLEEELDNETVDKVVDRMMIRAVFDLFYDFDEKEFRAALYERAAHFKELHSGEKRVLSGYSELSRKLENPIDNFITLKKKKK